MAEVQLGEIRYNAEASAFEARVDVRRGGQVFRYPCRVQGSATMPLEVIGAALARAALSMSDTGHWPD